MKILTILLLAFTATFFFGCSEQKVTPSEAVITSPEDGPCYVSACAAFKGQSYLPQAGTIHLYHIQPGDPIPDPMPESLCVAETTWDDGDPMTASEVKYARSSGVWLAKAHVLIISEPHGPWQDLSTEVCMGLDGLSPDYFLGYCMFKPY